MIKKTTVRFVMLMMDFTDEGEMTSKKCLGHKSPFLTCML
jgi:hypothetical protein